MLMTSTKPNFRFAALSIRKSSKRTVQPKSRSRQAFTLIEMIGIVTVLLILALALGPLLIKQLDQMAGDKEAAELKALVVGLRQGVLRAKVIPDQNGWDSMISTNIGLQIDQVRRNARGVPRLFLIDPGFGATGGGGVGLYSQTINGTPSVPLSPRLMIISSISKALPSALTNGVTPTSGDFTFDNIWNAAEGTLPSGSGWTSWGGRGDDLKVQHIHLSDVFVSFTMNGDGTTPGEYGIDGFSEIPIPSPIVFTTYFFDSTLLRLYDKTDHFEFSEILHESKSFFSIFGSIQGQRFLGRTIDRLTPLDLQRAADAFTASSTNHCAFNAGITPWTVYYGMIAFMSNYVNWGDSGFQGCQKPCGNGNPSGTFGSVLNGNQTQIGSQAYLDAKSNGLICQQVN